ncbi:MAG: alanine racemase [Arachnia sp.]
MGGTCELTVDLDAINENLRLVARLAAGRTVLAAVKANAYGHGLVEVARSIEGSGSAQWLGVATVSEAVALRAAGVTLPILKFSLTLPDELPEALGAGIVFTVGDQEAIDHLQRAAETAGVIAKAHLKIDTGMRRIGARPADAVRLARLIRDSSCLELGGLYTHLPVSDTPDGAAFTRGQFDAIAAAAKDVEDAVGPLSHVHAANSGAVLGHDLTGTSMVRPGIMVYGSYPDPGTPRAHALVPVLRWTSRVAFVKQVLAGETVGYGRAWTAPQDTWVATVAVGYGDGYSRRLSNRGHMLVDGTPRPVVGRVCMDQTMIDLGPQVPTTRVGDEVVLIGRAGENEISVEDVATLMGSIAYEVTCLIADRVPRRYLGGISPLSTR